MAVSTVGTGDPQEKADIGGVLRQWKKWRELCPYRPNAKAPVGEPKGEYVKGIKRTKQTYALTKNPEKAITFDPSVAMCFPGATMQSKPDITNGCLVSAQFEDEDRADPGITVERLTGRKTVASPPSRSNVTEAIGKVVAGNPPLLLSSVIYGRIIAFTVTSKETESEIRAAAKANYDGFAKIEGSLKAHCQKVLRESEVSIIGLNITPDQIKGLLKDGKLAESFTKQSFKSYGRIGYTLHTLDDVPAKMSETTTYDAVMWGKGTVTLKASRVAFAGERKPGSSDGASSPGCGEGRRVLWAVRPSGMIASMMTNRKAHAA